MTNVIPELYWILRDKGERDTFPNCHFGTLYAYLHELVFRSVDFFPILFPTLKYSDTFLKPIETEIG